MSSRQCVAGGHTVTRADMSVAKCLAIELIERRRRPALSALMVLPWEATPGHPVLAAVQLLKPLYE